MPSGPDDPMSNWDKRQGFTLISLTATALPPRFVAISQAKRVQGPCVWELDFSYDAGVLWSPKSLGFLLLKR
jgi:hypothetical protein